MDQKLEERVKEFRQELEPLLKKHRLKMGAVPTFPRYKILPIDVQLALEVLKNHGVQYHTGFQEADKEEVK